MSRYWVVAPYFADITSPNSVIFDRVWSYDLNHSTIAIGWNSLEDVSILSKPELGLVYRKKYPDSSLSHTTLVVNMIWSFYHEIKPGDIIIARKGRKIIVGIGTVTGMPFYDKEKGIKRVGNSNIYYDYPNFLPVEWENRKKYFENIVFGMSTLYSITQDKARSFIED